MEDLGAVVEDMDLTVEDSLRDKFESLLDQYLGDSGKTISEDVNSLPRVKAVALVKRLRKVYYMNQKERN